MWKFFTGKNKHSQKSDEDLLSVYKATGDGEVMGVLYDRYAQLLFGFCMKYLKDEEGSKDVVGQLFAKLFDDLKRFEVQHFKAWVTRVAFNACMSRLESERRNVYVREEFPEVEESAGASEGVPDETEVLEAMKSLKEEQRVCLELFYLNELSYAQVSERTGYQINQVKSFIQNGKRNLELYFRKKHESINK
ncbi:MAG: sigma-70 family RNA polymerase sigma factor [Bacteroidetes bacterium]|nr:sigma-70 family RNA polymerase sigma factor [Bacteroidota bacterium]